MAYTSSLSWPSMFNISQNQVSVLEDNNAIVNRDRLLILTEPTELYHQPNFGVGLKRHLWKYNTENEKAMINKRIIDQLRLHEPYVIADDTEYKDGLLFTGEESPLSYIYEASQLNMTVAMKTTYQDTVDLQLELFGEAQSDYA
ncbi:MAG: hypothetical protein LUC17_01300 [Oscillospiraceae bacterium]|nr:hypothetical protein [Oscillospiraceae bacterium]